jgi:putative FmdB family regulatory protein
VPTYAYACTACDHRFEAQQSFTDAALSACPQCEGRVRKLFNTVGIVFKGSGFYRTDSRNAGTAPTGASSSSSTGEPASTGTAKNGSDGSTSTSSTSTSSTSGATASATSAA